MVDEIKPKRQYNSTRRRAQAQVTRRQVIEAARRAFTARGFTGATMEMIAQEAGVSLETVYAIFGNKQTILTDLVGVTVVGDDEPVALLDRPGPQAVRQEHDQHRQIRMFAHDLQAIMSRMAPIFDMLHTAAKTEPDIATLLDRLLRERLHGMNFLVKALLSNGPLREGLDQATATETVWAISSAEVFTLLTVDRSWSLAKYEKWLAATLITLLLP
jgi:AcrR family transcriptional regulator